MLPQEEFVEIHATSTNGAGRYRPLPAIWALNRKTVRAHLQGKRQIGRRRRTGEDRFEKFEPYLHQRLADDPHIWGTVLYDEASEQRHPVLPVPLPHQKM